MLTGIATYGGLLKEPHWTAVPPGEWPRLAAALSPLRLEAGEFFMRPGDPAGRIGLIRKGLIRFYYVEEDGREVTKAFRTEGEWVSAYVEFLLDMPCRSHIQALEDTELAQLRREDVERLYTSHPCWSELGRRLAETQYLIKDARESDFMRLSAGQRYAQFLRDQPRLAGRLPQYHIASYLGITPVGLSRIASAMRSARPAGTPEDQGREARAGSRSRAAGAVRG